MLEMVRVRDKDTGHEINYPKQYVAGEPTLEVIKGESAYEGDGVTLRAPKHNPKVADRKPNDPGDTPNNAQ